MEPASPSPPVGGDGDVPGLSSTASAGDAVPGPDVCTTLLGSSFVDYFRYLGSKGLDSAALVELENAFDKLLHLVRTPEDAVRFVNFSPVMLREVGRELQRSSSSSSSAPHAAPSAPASRPAPPPSFAAVARSANLSMPRVSSVPPSTRTQIPIGPGPSTFRGSPSLAQAQRELQHIVAGPGSLWPLSSSPGDLLTGAASGIHGSRLVREVVVDNIRPRTRDFSRGRYKENVAVACGLRPDEIADVDFHNRYTFFLVHVHALQRFVNAVNNGALGLGSETQRPVVLSAYDPLDPATLSARERASIQDSDHRTRVRDQHGRRLQRLLDGLPRRPMPAGMKQAVAEFTSLRLQQLQHSLPSTSTPTPSSAPTASASAPPAEVDTTSPATTHTPSSAPAVVETTSTPPFTERGAVHPASLPVPGAPSTSSPVELDAGPADAHMSIAGPHDPPSCLDGDVPKRVRIADEMALPLPMGPSLN